MAQEPNKDQTVKESIFQADNPILKIIADYDKALENPDDQEAYQKAFEAMDQNQAWDFETQYKKILFKLKLYYRRRTWRELVGWAKTTGCFCQGIGK